MKKETKEAILSQPSPSMKCASEDKFFLKAKGDIEQLLENTPSWKRYELFSMILAGFEHAPMARLRFKNLVSLCMSQWMPPGENGIPFSVIMEASRKEKESMDAVTMERSAVLKR